MIEIIRWMIMCPYCGVTGNHTGTCELSLMQTGRHILVFAIEYAPKEENVNEEV